MAKKSSDKPLTSYDGEIEVNIDIAAVKEFYNKTRDKGFFLRDTFVTPRMYNLWRQEQLLPHPANPVERRWVSFNLRDFIWIQIVYDLRLMGCSMDDIRKAKEVCLQPLAESLDNNNIQKPLEAILKAMRRDKHLSEIEIRQFEDYLKANPMKKIVSDNPEMNITLLDAALNNIIASGNDWDLYLFLPARFPLQNEGSNKESISATAAEPAFKYTSAAQKRKMRQSGLRPFLFSGDFAKRSMGLNLDAVNELPHIKIPIKNYFWGFLLDPAMQKQLSKMELLTPEEFRLIEEVRLGNKKEIVIKFNDGKIERIEIMKDLEKNAEKRLMELIMKGEYCNINVTAQNGKISSFEKTIKKKLK